MKTKLLFIWEHLKTSFWFLPLTLILLAIAAAFGLVYVDSRLSFEPVGIVGYFFGGGIDSARIILSTIAGAMLGVAGTVFSITLVTLTLASSQFGSRLIRNFMQDRLNQVVLGAYIATFIYCLLVLRTVISGEALEFVPNISVLAAILISVANILLLVIFIHHVSIGIQADQVISEISVNLKKSIEELYPEQIGKPGGLDEEESIQKQEKDMSTGVNSTKSGYLQAIDSQVLMDGAQEQDLLLTLHFKPGDFLVCDEVLFTINSHLEVPKYTIEDLRDAFIISDKRTPIQDSEFAVHQLVEVASRALSSGINDPYTAITCIDKLTETMCLLARKKFPSPNRYDSENEVRVIAKPLSFSGMMDASFNQIRQYGKDMPTILIRLLESLHKINYFNDEKGSDQSASVEKHAAMVLYTAKHANLHPGDLADIQERFDKLELRSLTV